MITTLLPTQKSADRPPAILSLIGETPLVEITRIDTGPCQLFLKLENQNPTGSIKDRVALAMIEAAEGEGKLKPGGTVIEATAGNTGLGLALVAGAKGYRVLLVIPDKMSQEKISHVRALRAEVRITRADVAASHIRPGDPHFRAESSYVRNFFLRHLVWDHQQDAIAFCAGNERQPQTGIPCGSLHDRAARLQISLSLGRFD